MPNLPQAEPFLRELTARLLGRARTAVRPLIPSETLRDNIEIHLEPAGPAGYLEIPHYWAVYIHNGRRPFGPRRTKYLVWFTNPRDDPRLRPLPVRYSDWRPLTDAEFQYGLRQNGFNRVLGLDPYMVVARYQPRPLKGTFFFSKGLKPFEEAVIPPVTLEAVTKFIARVSLAVTPRVQKPVLVKIR